MARHELGVQKKKLSYYEFFALLMMAAHQPKIYKHSISEFEIHVDADEVAAVVTLLRGLFPNETTMRASSKNEAYFILKRNVLSFTRNSWKKLPDANERWRNTSGMLSGIDRSSAAKAARLGAMYGTDALTATELEARNAIARERLDKIQGTWIDEVASIDYDKIEKLIFKK